MYCYLEKTDKYMIVTVYRTERGIINKFVILIMTFHSVIYRDAAILLFLRASAPFCCEEV